MSVYPYLRRNKKDPSIGTVYIHKVDGGKLKKDSLRLKVKFKDWDERHWVKGGPDQARMNEIIREALVRAGRTDLESSTGSAYFIPYLRSEIDAKDEVTGDPMYRASTASSYRYAVNALQRFVGDRKPRFDDINRKFIGDFYQWLLSSRGMQVAGARLYLNYISAVAMTAQHKGLYVFPTDTFKPIKARLTAKQKTETKAASQRPHKALTTQQIFEFANAPRLTGKQFEVQQCFLAAIYAQGARVSDVLLWRWRDIKDGKTLCYSTRKTGKQFEVPVLDLFADIICQAANRVDKHVMEPYNEADHFFGYYYYGDFMPDSLRSKMSQEEFELELIRERDKRRAACLQRISQLYNESFIFHILDSRIITPDIDPATMTSRQNSHIGSRRTAYNEQLEAICKKAKLEPVSSHSARHSYATMLRDLSVDTSTICDLLGQHSVTMTQRYIGRLGVAKISEISKKVSNAVEGMAVTLMSSQPNMPDWEYPHVKRIEISQFYKAD